MTAPFARRVATWLQTAAIVSSLSAALAAAPVLNAQTLAIPAGTSETEIVATAEAEGVAFLRAQPVAAPDVPRRRCVAVGPEGGTVVSGEFTIGGDLGARSSLRAGSAKKIWWAPRHQAADMPPLVVRGRNLSTLGDTLRLATARIAWPVVRGDAQLPTAERKYFFPSVVTFPRAGRWLLVAASGSNWGCFILTVSQDHRPDGLAYVAADKAVIEARAARVPL